MADVALKFNPPADPDITALHIEEANDSTGPWVPIDIEEDVGAYPDYISEYTTSLATSNMAWFRIRWRDTKGAFTDYSQPVQGGTSSLVAEVKDRVMQRDPMLVDAIVYQEAEAVVSQVFGTENPYDPTLSASYRVLSGLVYLTLARSLIARVIQSSVENIESATIGIVSFKTVAKVESIEKSVAPLIAMANSMLGISTSFVLVMEEVTLASKSRSSYDHSRLIEHVGLE